MGWILKDFECQACSHIFEALAWVGMEEDESCPQCGNTHSKPIISAPKPATFSLMSQEDKARHLRKRSRDHTRKELKKDPTQIATTKRLKLKGSG